MAWQPLWVRKAWTPPEAPHEGVPAHLQRPLVYWVETVIYPPRIRGHDPEVLARQIHDEDGHYAGLLVLTEEEWQEAVFSGWWTTAAEF